MIDFNKHAQLLRELAEHAESPTELAPFEISDLATRARQAAEEIEGWEVPSDEELQELWIGGNWYNEGATLREFGSITRLVLARLGGGEGQP